MEFAFTYLHLLAAGLLVGKVSLLSFVVAPILAKQLDAESFGRVVRQLFPAYYTMGIAAAVLGLVSLGVLGIVRGFAAAPGIAVGLWAIVLAAEGYCRAPLTPRSNAMRDELKRQRARGVVSAELQAAWERLHRRSVYLNSLVLLIGLGVLALSTVVLS